MGLALKKLRKKADREAEEILQKQTTTLESMIKDSCSSIKTSIYDAKDALQDQETILQGVMANVGSETLPSNVLGTEAPESDEGSTFGRG